MNTNLGGGWSLTEFGRFLVEKADVLNTAAIKEIPFGKTNPVSGERCVLRADSAHDVACVVALAAGLGWQGKRKFEIECAVARSLGLALPSAPGALQKSDITRAWDTDEAKARLFDELRLLEAHWPLQDIARDDKGQPRKDGVTKLPLAELSAAKVGTFLRDGKFADLLSGLDLADPAQQRALRDALCSRTTHPVRLSVDAGSGRDDVYGGFTKRDTVATHEMFQGTVSEQDYGVAQRPALTCSAGFHHQDWLALTSVNHQGQDVLLADLLKHDCALREEVGAILGRWAGGFGFCGHVTLLETLASFDDAELSGEPQLFCGAPDALAVVAPLMPVGLPFELARARKSLDALHQARTRPAEIQQKELELGAAQAAAKAIKSRKDSSFAEGRAERAVALAAAEKLVKEKELELKAANASTLFVPSYHLTLGGGNPQNLASGLTSEIHRMPLYTRIGPRPRHAKASGKVFHPESLLSAPDLRKDAAVKKLANGGDQVPGKRERRALFLEWSLLTMAPLIEVCVSWREASEWGSESLSPGARSHLLADSSVHAKFIVGCDLNVHEASEAFQPLAQEVVGHIKDALRNAAPNVSFDEYDPEIAAAALAAVLMERA